MLGMRVVMRVLEKAFDTKDNTKFEQAEKAYKELCGYILAREHSEIEFGAKLLNFQKEKLYSVIKPDSGYQFSATYSNIYVFCEREFGLKKRAVANRIAVAKRFANKEGQVLPAWANYSYSQLVVMLDVLKHSNSLVERFTSDMRVSDMKMLSKAIQKGTFDYLLSNDENIVKINEFLEAEKAGKAEEAQKNIEAVEEKYEKNDKITAEGELISADSEVHICAPFNEKELTKRLKKVFRENSITFLRDNKKATVETVVKYIIKGVYNEGF